MYSSLDEKMPRPLCGHGMTLGGGLCPCGRHVIAPAPCAGAEGRHGMTVWHRVPHHRGAME